MTGAVRMSPAVTGKPASASAPAIDARVREVVLVTRASGYPAARSHCSAATAQGSGVHQALEAVAVEDNRTAERRTLEARALFVFIGVTPCTGWLSGEGAMAIRLAFERARAT